MPRLLQKSWLDSYLEYQDNTEIPRNYLIWTAISAISSSLKRNVYLWYKGIQFYPNQYIVLVGPPGVGKGSAMHPALKIVNDAGTANTLEDKITAERIIEKLAVGFSKMQVNINLSPGQVSLMNDHTATIVSTELSVFLSSSDWLHSLLCDFWDKGKFTYETKHRGAYTINELCVSLIAGCVPEFIRSLTKEKMAPITGGFTARTIFVYASERYKLIDDAWGAPIAKIDKLKDDLVNDLQHIASLKGQMHMSDEAKLLWKQKYHEHNKADEFSSDVLANFKSRISSHIIKVALSISIAESDSLIITKSQLERAIQLVEEARDKVDIVFRHVGESSLIVAQSRVQEFIEKRGIASRREILRYNYKHVTDEQLTLILLTLTKAGLIEEFTEGNKLMYKSLI